MGIGSLILDRSSRIVGRDFRIVNLESHIMNYKKTVFLGFIACTTLFATSARADFNAVLVPGKLVLFGDDTAEAITIRQSDTEFLIRGREGTLIEGQSIIQIPSLTVEDIVIVTRGGKDKVTFKGVNILGEVFVSTGGGRDQIRFDDDSVVTGETTLDVGFGNDKIILFNSAFGESVEVIGNTGRTSVLTDNAFVADALDIVSDLARDGVEVVDSVIDGLLLVTSNAGNDKVTVTDSLLGGAGINTGAGSDCVTIENTFVTLDLLVETEEGADKVDLFDVQSDNSIVVFAGTGNDTVSASEVDSPMDLLLNGGDDAEGEDFDIFNELGPINGDLSESVIEFEQVISLPAVE